MSRSSSLNTVKKIGPVLELFTQDKPEWRMTEIARALEMPKSSAHALVSTLAEIGLLTVGGDARYRLGWNLLTLAERMRSSLEFRQHALPAMQELSRSLKETVLLGALDRNEVIYVERSEGRHPMVRLAGVSIGSRVPAHATACGKVLLAHRDSNEVRALYADRPLRALTRNTITDFSALEDELIKTRRRGFAFDRQEIVADIACVATPVCDRYGTVVAALSVSMPAYRFPSNVQDLVRAARETAVEISTCIAAAQHERDCAITAESDMFVVA